MNKFSFLRCGNRRRLGGSLALPGAFIFVSFILGVAAFAPFSLFAQAASTNTPSRDQIILRNGDLLFGRLLGVTSGQILQWQHPDATEPMNFIVDNVSEVDLAAASRRAVDSQTVNCKILFANGDVLRGKLLGGDAESISLDVPGAGALKIPRNRLQSLGMISAEPPIIDGITGLDGWTEISSPIGGGVEPGHWTYRNGAFYASKPASVARDLKLPAMMRMEFDLAWRGQPNLAIALYTDSLKPILLLNKDQGPDFGAFYSFRLGGIVADMYPIKKFGPSVSLGSVILASLSRAEHAHFDFRVSKPQNKIILLVDGALAAQWSDPNGFEGEGSGVRFVENSGAIKLSNLRVTRWDGILEEKPEAPPNGPDDVVWLQEGQSLSGNISALTAQSLTLRVQNNPQTISLAKIREIDFAAPSVRPPLDPVGGIRATFAQGGSIHAQLESWGSDAAIFRSPDFGRAKFNPSLFATVQFLRDEGN